MSTQNDDETDELPPEIRPPLPDTEWSTDAHWGQALGISPKQFRKHVYDKSIPHVPFGKGMLIEARDIYATLATLKRTGPPDGKKKG